MFGPLVSVVIPTYNHAQFVGYAVKSVLAQTYPNIEIIVVDDGSTDETADILKPYLARIIYLFKPNGGTPNALNYGIERTKGKYVCWLSADDAFRPEKIAKQLTQMESKPEIGFAYTSFAVIDGEGKKLYDVHSQTYLSTQEMVRKLREGNFINGSSVMMRKTALEKSGWFDEGLAQAHDHDLWFRLLRNFPCGFLDDLLLDYRWHGSNMSQHPDTSCEEIVRERAKRLFPEWL